MGWLADFAQLGALAVVCLGLLYLNGKQSDKYAKIIENNTEAMTRMTESNNSLKEVLDKQGEALDKQGVMLTQQNFLFQQMILKKGSE